MFKRKFEEAAEAAPAAEAAADPKATLVEALTAMGLNAEQAEAVFSMAQDLASAGGEAPAESEAVAVEASRQRRARRAEFRRRRARLSRSGRGRSLSGRRSVRGSSVRGNRDELSRRPRRSKMSAEERTIARQRRQIAKMKRELSAKENAPAARKLSNNPIKGASAAQKATFSGGSAKERVMNFVKDLI